MLAPRASAPRVTRCSLGKYWSHDFFQKEAESSRQGRVSATLVVDSDVLWFLPKSFSRAGSPLVLTLTLPSDVVWFKIENRRSTAVLAYFTL